MVDPNGPEQLQITPTVIGAADGLAAALPLLLLGAAVLGVEAFDDDEQADTTTRSASKTTAPITRLLSRKIFPPRVQV